MYFVAVYIAWIGIADAYLESLIWIRTMSSALGKVCPLHFGKSSEQKFITTCSLSEGVGDSNEDNVDR